LAGANPTTIQNTITAAFKDPFQLSSTSHAMIRITFVTGAGKLARQKYDETAAKVVMKTLQDLGYQEDRAASCVVECAGTFKSQHDTAKNLKTVVVFPKIGPAVITKSDDVLANGVRNVSLDSRDGVSLLGEDNSPKHMIAVSSFDVFSKMLSSKCPSWTQKKGCLGVISEIKDLIQSIDAKLLSGAPLIDSEQALYDSVSMSSLEEKENLVKTQMTEHIDEGNITRLERSNLLSQVRDKVDSLNKELDGAMSEGKPKKAEKILAQKEKATTRLAMLQSLEPKAPHALKYEREINKLREELKPLLKLEEETKGRLLSVKEATTLSRKDEIINEIQELEVSVTQTH